jgi:NAD+ diphosphatase
VSHPHLDLSDGSHDRSAIRRGDDAWLDEQWTDPATRVLLLSGTRLRATPEGALQWVSPADAPEGIRVLLGVRDGVTYFAMLLDPQTAPGTKEEWLGLRGFVPHFERDSSEAPLVFHAMGIAEWHWRTRFCPYCGHRLTSRQAGHVLGCDACGKDQFPRTDPAVIMIVAHGEPGSEDERCLLGRGVIWPEGRYSTLAGFLEPGETLEDAVRREVLEEVGVQVGEVEWFGNQPWPFPGSLMLGFTARALTTEINVDGSEIADARWFTRAEMKAESEAGTVVLPGRGVSISRSLVEHWYGGELPGAW